MYKTALCNALITYKDIKNSILKISESIPDVFARIKDNATQEAQ